MPLKKKSKKAADVNIYTDADARSTAVLATKTDIASESDMIADAKRSLAECLDTDELHSEVLYDNMYTGNDKGLGIVREHARIPALETKLEGLQKELYDERKERRDQFSELHNAFNRLAQQTDARFSVRYADIRSRFLSTFRRGFMDDESREDQKVIDQGNVAAHHGFFMADAMLYDPEGFINKHSQQFPPRTDLDTFKLLYGVDPSLAKKIDYTPTVQVLERHAMVRASSRFQMTALFEEKFQAFIRALKATDYAGDYLNFQSDQVAELLFAYQEFWKASRQCQPLR
ncbi:hypothetical protein Aspvir_004038 [Aspergillus viridinutans]|uniref:Uncharacterized protein n=1 Tax=Aspergillus viridinutans TaxID=75553 RepID=A0A9P3F2Y9_ASPVI|nr:uncharacterized protein Aspvir_004038 [Aspergillus viridinutans]GIK00025.1 hypothetical protein Aspvir_004038 [Aspergillus viridinutans]